jgi:hypothetical protein
MILALAMGRGTLPIFAETGILVYVASNPHFGKPKRPFVHETEYR